VPLGARSHMGEGDGSFQHLRCNGLKPSLAIQWVPAAHCVGYRGASRVTEPTRSPTAAPRTLAEGRGKVPAATSSPPSKGRTQPLLLLPARRTRAQPPWLAAPPALPSSACLLGCFERGAQRLAEPGRVL